MESADKIWDVALTAVGDAIVCDTTRCNCALNRRLLISHEFWAAICYFSSVTLDLF